MASILGFPWPTTSKSNEPSVPLIPHCYVRHHKASISDSSHKRKWLLCGTSDTSNCVALVACSISEIMRKFLLKEMEGRIMTVAATVRYGITLELGYSFLEGLGGRGGRPLAPSPFLCSEGEGSFLRMVAVVELSTSPIRVLLLALAFSFFFFFFFYDLIQIIITRIGLCYPSFICNLCIRPLII